MLLGKWHFHNLNKKRLTCCIKASKLPMNTMDVQFCSDFFSFFCSSIGSQWARRLRLHFTGLDVTIKCDRIPPSFSTAWSLLNYTPLSIGEKTNHNNRANLRQTYFIWLFLFKILSDIGPPVLKRILCKTEDTYATVKKYWKN